VEDINNPDYSEKVPEYRLTVGLYNLSIYSNVTTDTPLVPNPRPIIVLVFVYNYYFQGTRLWYTLCSLFLSTVSFLQKSSSGLRFSRIFRERSKIR
jgi:hypothetical protein